LYSFSLGFKYRAILISDIYATYIIVIFVDISRNIEFYS